MSTTTTDTVTVEKGLGRKLAVVAARIFAPGVALTLALQHAIVLPAALAPVAAFLGLHAGA